MRIKFNKIDRFIKIYDGTRYLTLFGSERYNTICNRIRCLISLKSSITYASQPVSLSREVDSFDSLPIEKTLTFHNALLLITSIFNKD